MEKINNQLLYSGIIEGIKLILQGFPVKIKLEKLRDEFRFLRAHGDDIISMLKDNEEYGRKFAIGRSKLFLKDIYNKFLKMNSVLRDKIIVYIQK